MDKNIDLIKEVENIVSKYSANEDKTVYSGHLHDCISIWGDIF